MQRQAFWKRNSNLYFIAMCSWNGSTNAWVSERWILKKGMRCFLTNSYFCSLVVYSSKMFRELINNNSSHMDLRGAEPGEVQMQVAWRLINKKADAMEPAKTFWRWEVCLGSKTFKKIWSRSYKNEEPDSSILLMYICISCCVPQPLPFCWGLSLRINNTPLDWQWEAR